jgi:hypothetical protein
MSCSTVILNGIARDCNTVSASIGADKDLILVNYDSFQLTPTKALANRQLDDTYFNKDGLTSIFLKTTAMQHVFSGTDYSVIPSVTSEIKEDGNTSFVHSISFTVYSKLAKDRKTLEALANSRVIAITKDRSTGLLELFGMYQGLKLSAIERVYVGTQNSNFYTVTIATPDIAVVREPSLGELAVNIQVGVATP